jgi:hypothetical protein
VTNKDEEIFEWAFNNPSRRHKVRNKITSAELAYEWALWNGQERKTI